MNQKNLKKGEMNDEKKNHGTGNGGIYFRSLRMLGGKRNSSSFGLKAVHIV